MGACANQILEKAKEDSFFVGVSGEGGAIARERFYLIFPMSRGRTNMHIGRVFVPKNAVLDFCPLPRVDSNGSIVTVER